jgi:hypothetical protein
MRRLPPNLPKPSKHETERAQQQLTRVTRAIRRLGRKVKARRRSWSSRSVPSQTAATNSSPARTAVGRLRANSVVRSQKA